jgi:A/G-specific adenine glycosylase
MPARRASAVVASKKKVDDDRDEEEDGYDDADQEAYLSEESDTAKRPRKKTKTGKADKGASGKVMLAMFEGQIETVKGAAEPPLRKHTMQYHRPLLLDTDRGRQGRDDLLAWFDGVSTSRSMPWRKKWIDPSDYNDPSVLRETLKKRAYEVWISEIMLQQTRVATVIDYWTKWIAKWPTIEDLAKAEPEEVLSSWRGLGYYSRATRIHTAAKKVVEDQEMQGMLPETADLLEKNVPGIGRYTGGAIASIVFGNAAPMVDGNVLRVLSRHLGLYGDVKGSKQVIDVLWGAADALVQQIAKDGSDQDRNSMKSDRPGRWGQALMELGSTVCTPNPSCRSCPISATCRTFAEGRLIAAKGGILSMQEAGNMIDINDIEDLCAICEPFEDDTNAANAAVSNGNVKEKAKANGKQATLSAFAFTGKASTAAKQETSLKSSKVMDTIESHSKRFPLKVVKKAVRQEECIVCAICNEKGEYLLHQRPDKGERSIYSI